MNKTGLSQIKTVVKHLGNRSGTIENFKTHSFTSWFGNCKTHEKRQLNRIVKNGSYIVGSALRRLDEMYEHCCTCRNANIIRYFPLLSFSTYPPTIWAEVQEVQHQNHQDAQKLLWTGYKTVEQTESWTPPLLTAPHRVTAQIKPPPFHNKKSHNTLPLYSSLYKNVAANWGQFLLWHGKLWGWLMATSL